METKTIYVMRKGKKNKIRLFCSDGSNGDNSNDIETGVDPSDRIIWRLAENSGLDSLDGIKYNNKANEILTGIPISIDPSVYSGIVVPISPGPGKKLKYEVHYTIGGNAHSQDPKLIMKT